MSIFALYSVADELVPATILVDPANLFVNSDIELENAANCSLIVELFDEYVVKVLSILNNLCLISSRFSEEIALVRFAIVVGPNSTC